MTTQIFYQFPSSFILISFILFSIFFAIIGSIVFSFLFPYEHGAQIFGDRGTIYIGAAVTTVIGIVTAFIITNQAQDVSDASQNTYIEANTIYSLYYTVFYLENTEDLQILIKDYLCSIINVEFPELQNGNFPTDNTLIQAIQDALFAYEPNSSISNQIPLYEKAISLFDNARQLRAKRIESANIGLSKELWWVLILGYIIVVVIAIIVTTCIFNRIMASSFVSVTYAIMIFIAVVLNYPFQGEFGIKPTPYQYAVELLGYKCPPKNGGGLDSFAQLKK